MKIIMVNRIPAAQLKSTASPSKIMSRASVDSDEFELGIVSVVVKDGDILMKAANGFTASSTLLHLSNSGLFTHNGRLGDTKELMTSVYVQKIE